MTQNVVAAKCKRCHRPLTSEKSISQGRGRVCQAKYEAAVAAAANAQPADRIAKATEAIEDGAVAHRTRNLFQVVSSNGTDVYDVDLGTGGCTCRASQFGLSCWHVAAAQLEAA